MNKNENSLSIEGVIVAACHQIEWVLPWWWYNYQAHNNYPVAFFDLGMTEKGKSFCHKHGLLLKPQIPSSFVLEKEKTPKCLAEKWEKLIGSGIWDIREKWFQKPFVFGSTPFQKTLWIDLDCEVRSSLSPIFSSLTQDFELAIGEEPTPLQEYLLALGLSLPGEKILNSGVVAYYQNSPFLKAWRQETLNHYFIHIGDQEALSRVLFTKSHPYKLLNSVYNWDRGLGPNSNALIFHWHGQPGKKEIKKQINFLQCIGLANLNL